VIEGKQQTLGKSRLTWPAATACSRMWSGTRWRIVPRRQTAPGSTKDTFQVVVHP